MCISESKKQNKKQILQSVLNLEMFQNYLGNFKKKILITRLHTRDSQTGRPEAESWNLYF